MNDWYIYTGFLLTFILTVYCSYKWGRSDERKWWNKRTVKRAFQTVDLFPFRGTPLPKVNGPHWLQRRHVRRF